MKNLLKCSLVLFVLFALPGCISESEPQSDKQPADDSSQSAHQDEPLTSSKQIDVAELSEEEILDALKELRCEIFDGSEKWPEGISVSLRSSEQSDLENKIRLIGGLTDLRALYIESYVTDFNFMYLQKLTKLKSLGLFVTKGADTGLESLRGGACIDRRDQFQADRFVDEVVVISLVDLVLR